MSENAKTYGCLYCGRILVGEPLEQGNFLFTHDDVPHPPQETFDEEERPQ